MDNMALYNQWEQLRAKQPQLKTLDIADQLGVTEGEIIASRVGHEVIKLVPIWQDLLPAIERFGTIRALTRNPYCVIERNGKYVETMIGEDAEVGLIVSSDIDLRFLLGNWESAFAVIDRYPKNNGQEKVLRSIQFFNKQGMAAHKVYLLEESNLHEWDAFIAQFKAPEQSPYLLTKPNQLVNTTPPDQQVDIQLFRKSWSELKDTHHFTPMLEAYKLPRIQALKLAGNDWAEPLSVDFLVAVFEQAKLLDQQMMIFVGNESCVQIHTGIVNNIKWLNGWFNILDPVFNLHLKMEGVAELWRVRKPTTEGIVTSIEAYDKEGNIILQLFGPRRPGIPERKAWRQLAESFPSLDKCCA